MCGHCGARLYNDKKAYTPFCVCGKAWSNRQGCEGGEAATQKSPGEESDLEEQQKCIGKVLGELLSGKVADEDLAKVIKE